MITKPTIDISDKMVDLKRACDLREDTKKKEKTIPERMILNFHFVAERGNFDTFHKNP